MVFQELSSLRKRDWDELGKIEERLDHLLANDTWLKAWPATALYHGPFVGSDHRSSILHFSLTLCTGPRPFCLELSWVWDPEFSSVVKEAWNDNVDGTFFSSWFSNIDNCKENFGVWSSKFKNSRKTINCCCCLSSSLTSTKLFCR